jgi:hypothetical protein
MAQALQPLHGDPIDLSALIAPQPRQAPAPLGGASSERGQGQGYRRDDTERRHALLASLRSAIEFLDEGANQDEAPNSPQSATRELRR